MKESAETIAHKLCLYLQENTLAEGVKIYPETPFSDVGIDSYSIVDLVLYIERNYGIEIPDKDLTADNLGSAIKLAECTVSNRTI